MPVDPRLENEVRRHTGPDALRRAQHARADVVVTAGVLGVATTTERRLRVREASIEGLAATEAFVETGGRRRAADRVALPVAHRAAIARASAVGEATDRAARPAAAARAFASVGQRTRADLHVGDGVGARVLRVGDPRRLAGLARLCDTVADADADVFGVEITADEAGRARPRREALVAEAAVGAVGAGRVGAVFGERPRRTRGGGRGDVCRARRRAGQQSATERELTGEMGRHPHLDRVGLRGALGVLPEHVEASQAAALVTALARRFVQPTHQRLRALDALERRVVEALESGRVVAEELKPGAVLPSREPARRSRDGAFGEVPVGHDHGALVDRVEVLDDERRERVALGLGEPRAGRVLEDAGDGATVRDTERAEQVLRVAAHIGTHGRGPANRLQVHLDHAGDGPSADVGEQARPVRGSAGIADPIAPAGGDIAARSVGLLVLEVHRERHREPRRTARRGVAETVDEPRFTALFGGRVVVIEAVGDGDEREAHGTRREPGGVEDAVPEREADARRAVGRAELREIVADGLGHGREQRRGEEQLRRTLGFAETEHAAEVEPVGLELVEGRAVLHEQIGRRQRGDGRQRGEIVHPAGVRLAVLPVRARRSTGGRPGLLRRGAGARRAGDRRDERQTEERREGPPAGGRDHHARNVSGFGAEARFSYYCGRTTTSFNLALTPSYLARISPSASLSVAARSFVSPGSAARSKSKKREPAWT